MAQHDSNVDPRRRKRTVLFIYNGSVRGRLSGGEHVYGEIRAILRRNFDVRELILDDLLLKLPCELRPIMKRVGLVFLVLTSYLLYNQYNIVVTTWTPEVPFCGDVAYIQSYAGLFEPQNADDGILEEFGRRLLAFPMRLLAYVSLRRQTFISASGFCEENVMRKFKKTSRVIYPPAKLRPYFAAEPKENLVLSVGRISPEKNFEALAHVGPEVPEARFVLVGPIALQNQRIVDKIQDSFAKNNLESNFKYEGWISEESKQGLQDAAKVFFHPALNDPFPLAIIEAMNHGTIPVIHDSGGAKELVPYVVTYHTLEEAVTRIKKALNEWSPETALQLHRESLRFSVNTFEEQLLQVLQQTAETKARARRTKNA